MKRISIDDLERRCGERFKDGRGVPLAYVWKARTAQQGDDEGGGPIHKAQQTLGQVHFLKLGYRIFPYQIGLDRTGANAVYALADFAVARYSRVMLVECLTDLDPSSEHVMKMSLFMPPPTLEDLMLQRITHKRQLEQPDHRFELWFIVEPLGKKLLKAASFHCKRLSCPPRHECAKYKPLFWLCHCGRPE